MLLIDVNVEHHGILMHAHDEESLTVPVEAAWPGVLKRAEDIFGGKLTKTIMCGSSRSLSSSDLLQLATNDGGRTALTTAVDIAEGLLALEAKPTVQAWFVGKNGMLGDKAPALVVRADPDSVREAARQFAAYG